MSPHILCIGGEDHELRIPFIAALGERGLRVTSAGTGDAGPFERAGLAYRPFRFDRSINPASDLAALKALKQMFVELRPDLVQSFDTKPNLFAPLAARSVPGLPVVRTINGLGWIFSSRSPTALALIPVYWLLHRLASRSTAMTIFQNADDQCFFERRRMADVTKSQLIPGSGIDIARFEEAARTGPAPHLLRQELSLDDNEVVLTVTRITRQKGIPTLLKAAARVHEQLPNVRFLLVGPRESEGRSAVPQADIDRHAPYLTALGRRDDIPSLLRMADVFAFPTEYREGVPRVLLEAAVAELPIVTTDLPGCRDVVRDGWSGCLVPPRSPDALAARIGDLLRDRVGARVMGRRAAEFVRREFSLDKTVERYVATYAEVLKSARSRPISRERRATARSGVDTTSDNARLNRISVNAEAAR